MAFLKLTLASSYFPNSINAIPRLLLNSGLLGSNLTALS